MTDPFDDLRRSVLAPSDAADALRLSTEAGWNQTDADWRFMARKGHGWGLRDPGGRLVATALTLPFGRFAWIGMLLVTLDYRRRGIATALLRRCLDHLKSRDLIPALDATEAGRKVYLRLGFEDVYGITRMRAAAVTRGGGETAGLRSIGPDHLATLFAFDRTAFGADRSAVLAYLLGRRPDHAFATFRDGVLVGYVLARAGRRAHHLGPLAAVDEATAVGLASRALADLEGSVIIDSPDRHAGFNRWLAARGFAPDRPFTRMILGCRRPFDDPGRIFAIAGPELG